MAAFETPRLRRAGRAALLRGIYAIVNEGQPDPVALARAVIEGGVRIVQYRAKSGIVERRLRELRGLTHEFGALLIVNDDVAAALEFDADGVHLGPDDRGFGEVVSVRAALGERLIGLSCGSVAEARAADIADADYVGIGSVYPTSSKDDAGDPIGIGGFRRIAAATRLPAAAIGGIGPESVAEVARNGAAMAAVISAIASAANPAAVAARLVRVWNGCAVTLSAETK